MAAKPNPVALAKARERAKNRQHDFYSKVIIHKHRRSALGLLVPAISVLFTLIIFGYLMKGENWVIIAGPVLLIGMVLILFPSTEEWNYTPWQSNAQQYERHFNERG